MKVASVLFAASVLLVIAPGSAILRGMSDEERILWKNKKKNMEMRTMARDTPAPTPVPTSPPTPAPTSPPTPASTSPPKIPLSPSDPAGGARAPWFQCEGDTLCDVNYSVSACENCNCSVSCQMKIENDCEGECAHDGSRCTTDSPCAYKMCDEEKKCQNGNLCKNAGNPDSACGRHDCEIFKCF